MTISQCGRCLQIHLTVHDIVNQMIEQGNPLALGLACFRLMAFGMLPVNFERRYDSCVHVLAALSYFQVLGQGVRLARTLAKI